MKNTILILITILMSVFGALSLVSSGYDYAAEKLFYRAMKVSSKIPVGGDAPAPKLMRYVEGNLQQVVKRYAQSPVAKEAHFILAEFYVNHKWHLQALPTLYDIINAYPEDRAILAGAHFLRGVAFEDLNQWDKALREYKIVRDQYSETPLALRVPLYIAEHYKAQSDYAQAEQAYNEAAIFYNREEIRSRGTARGYAAANSLLQAYIELEQYEQAGETVEKIIQLYPKVLPLAQQLANIELIFIKKLNKVDKALQLFENIRVKTNNSELISILDEKIRGLEALR